MECPMQKIRLGRTDLQVTRTAFGALPIQRVDMATATTILRRAVELGVNFFDTARGYSDSEEKLGAALTDVREDVIIATKVPGRDRASVLELLETSLAKLRTDRVDILQLHNPGDLPDPDDPESAYAGLIEARGQGKTRFIGITNHRLDNAVAAAESGLYDTIQYPVSPLSAEKDLEFVSLCQARDVGVIAMKALSGGLVRNVEGAFAFFRQFEHVAAIWGIQRMSELEQFAALEADPPALDDAMRESIRADREELGADFCRGCGYCLPCPNGIEVPMAARMKYLLRRSPSARLLTADWQERMRRIEQCTECGQCRQRCPYELDTPTLLRKMLEDYETVIAGGAESI